MTSTHVLNRRGGAGGVQSPADRLPLSAGPMRLPVPVDGCPLTLHPGLDSMACGNAPLLPRTPLQREHRDVRRMGSWPD